ncbi:hypothetical protein ACTWQL_14325 [Pseudalkalibacillus sp. R45]|uniref:hypothetical protein n=1 Tax=Pseudalkalibacillus sp. R45 TaxID=3457433 RepID=UPI003FCED61D
MKKIVQQQVIRTSHFTDSSRCPCEVMLKILNTPVEIQQSGRKIGYGFLTLTGKLCPTCKKSESFFNVRVHGDLGYRYKTENLKGITCQYNYVEAFGEGRVASRNAPYNLLLVEDQRGEIMISLTIRGKTCDFNFSGVTRKQNVIRTNCTS